MQLQTIRRLKAKIENWVNTTSVEIQDDLAKDVAETLEKHADAVKETFPEGSFQRLFWDQQMSVTRAKGPTGRRWHPIIIRLAMNLKMQSSSAYRSLRTSGFLVLPSERTLNDYVHFYDCSAGCHKDLQDALAAEAQVDKLTDVQKFVAQSLDEMRVREDLVYNKNTRFEIARDETTSLRLRRRVSIHDHGVINGHLGQIESL